MKKIKVFCFVFSVVSSVPFIGVNSSNETNSTSDKSKRSLTDQIADGYYHQFPAKRNKIQLPAYSSIYFNTPSLTFSSEQTYFRSLTDQSPATQYGPNYYDSVLAENGPINCGPVIGSCAHFRYRTFDGSCNNLRNPGLGAANTVFSRLAPPKYADGSYQPPVSVSRKPLPNARLLSLVFFPDAKLDDPQLTLAAMQWGQLMTHDMALATGTTPTAQQSARCCTNDGRLVSTEGVTARYCFPITIPEDDPLFIKFQQGCMNFARTLTDQDVGCGRKLHPAEQLVSVSHFLDASNVYGSGEDVAASLRTFVGGKMSMEYRNGETWPPMNVNGSTVCPVRSGPRVCYVGGDVRINQNTQLTILQIMLLREHNRVAGALSELNPHWDDERIYQEARKIVIAEIQLISYYEWLPIFFGLENLLNYGIVYDPKTNIHVNDYNANVDPRVINEHSTAAFRAFHTNIQGFLQLFTEERINRGNVRLSDYFNNPSILEFGDNFNDLARGMVTQPQHSTDPYHTVEITDFLFRGDRPFGLDLKAFDIQRGRDHGLASYNTMREFCGLKRALHFDDFLDHLTPDIVDKLKTLYEHPDDVDLDVGGFLETYLPEALTGPTFLCIMLEQFYRTRAGDRFFFENAQHETAFTPEQLIEIRKTSFARLMCDNGNNIHSMQPRAFVKISETNPLVPCSDFHSISMINLEAWREIEGNSVHELTQYFFK